MPAWEWALGASAVIGATVYLAHTFYPSLWNSPHPRLLLVVAGWCLVFLSVFFLALRRIGLRQPAEEMQAESRRWILLLAAAFFLLSGLTRAGMHGGGDARWYGTMLADMMAQTRAGVFPVWAGQSEYQFNGAIYPLRVAPGFHYMGALLDILTLRTLEVFALQNLLLVALGVTAIFSAYFCMAALLPGRRALAAWLAVLYLACPGVLGLAYNTDLYMSWTTLPWMPLIWLATVRSFREGGSLNSMLLLGTGLGLCWWGHSPIALWTTGCASIAQLARVAVKRPAGHSWLNAALGGLAFALIAGYPLASVLFFPPESGLSGRSFQPPTSPGMIVDFLRSVFPANWHPVSDNGQALSDFQIGYALAALWLFVSWHARKIRRPEVLVMLGLGAVLLFLLLPIPTLDTLLWSAVPSFVRDITARWVMNRLYLVLACLCVFAVAAAATELATDSRREKTLRWLLIVGCLWSVWEARKFSHGSQATAGNTLAAPRTLPTENVMLTRYAYFVYPQLPPYFTHGVTDPHLENRLWPESGSAPLADNYSAARATGNVVTQMEFTRKSGAIEETLPLPLTLEPGKRYLLAFDFADRNARGVLQFSGRTFFREYALPEYGEGLSFGVSGKRSNMLPVWTSQPGGEEVTLRFIRTISPDQPVLARSLGRIKLLSYDTAAFPVRVTSWIPYRAEVVASEPVWLETPRMFQQYYAARVNGTATEIRKSEAGLVMVRVPRGTAQVELTYRAPLGLAFSFWISLLALGVTAGWLISSSFAETFAQAER